MMTINYSLHTLLRLREHTKQMAENKLREAINSHIAEERKFVEIEHTLKNSIILRTQKQNNFFLKAQRLPCNKREIICHISSREKQIFDETALRKNLLKQQEKLRHSSLEVEIAKTQALDAHKNLRLIEKHHASWQQQQQRIENNKEENESDDRNGVFFLLKKA